MKRYNGKVWAGFFTERNQVIRIISVRRARINEQELYEKADETTAENLESRFDAGEDVSDYFDDKKSFRRNHLQNRVNLDLPRWMVEKIDRLAGQYGIPRQSQIKAWLSDRLKTESV
jgi:predicted DNA binding CopG/RHH family protein